MTCQVRRCKNHVYIIFYGFGVCESCWGKHCDGLLDLKQVFKIKDSSTNILIDDKDYLLKKKILVFDDWKDYFKGEG